jgi:hypothetical protein
VKSGAARFTPLDLGALLALAVLALLNLAMPFTWDQALFALGAKSVAHGGVLYRDYWDTKQPGVFVFYALGGRLFGFHEVGVHAFEMLWQLAFGFAAIQVLRRAVTHRAIASLAPLLAVGLYYAVSDDVKLTQVEALVGLPLLLTLWVALPADDGRPAGAPRFLLSGVLGGVVLLFKLMFAPLVAGLWLVLAVDAMRRARATPMRILLGMALPAALGLALPLAGTVAYFRAEGAWTQAWSTWIDFPLRVARGSHGFRLGNLVEGVSWYAFRFAPVLAVGALGLFTARDGTRRVVAWASAAWFALGLLVILSQRMSWWPYQYLLLIAPAGLLATLGVDAIWSRAASLAAPATARVRLAAWLLGALALSGAFGAQGLKVLQLARARFAVDARHRVAFQSAVATQMPYALVRDEVAFLSRPDAASGSVYFLANPLFEFFAGRETACGHNAAILTRFISADEWTLIAGALAERAPAYVFIEKQLVPIVDECRPRSAPFLDLLAARYHVLRRTDRGTWYAKGPAAAS